MLKQKGLFILTALVAGIPAAQALDLEINNKTTGGVLSSFKSRTGSQSDETFVVYSCKDDTLFVRFCGEGSTLNVADENVCVGNNKKIFTRMSFASYVRKQLGYTEVRNGLQEISAKEFEVSDDSQELVEARQSYNWASRNLDVLNGQPHYPKDRENLEKILQLEGRLVRSAQAHDEEIRGPGRKELNKKIADQIQDSLSLLCNPSKVQTAQAGSFLNVMLKRIDPTKIECADEKECNQKIVRDGVVVGTVMKRLIRESGSVAEHLRDDKTKIIWSPRSEHEIDGSGDTERYCARLEDLGKKWIVPNAKDLSTSFSGKGPQILGRIQLSDVISQNISGNMYRGIAEHVSCITDKQ